MPGGFKKPNVEPHDHVRDEPFRVNGKAVGPARCRICGLRWSVVCLGEIDRLVEDGLKSGRGARK